MKGTYSMHTPSGAQLIQNYLDTMINCIDPHSEDFLVVLAEVTTDLEFIPVWLAFQPQSKTMTSELEEQFRHYQDGVKNTPVQIDDGHTLTAQEYKDALNDFIQEHCTAQNHDPLQQATCNFVTALHTCLTNILAGTATRNDQIQEAIMQSQWIKTHLEAKLDATLNKTAFEKACKQLLQQKLDDFQEYVIKQDLEYLEQEKM